MIQHGARPTYPKKKDYGFVETHKEDLERRFGAVPSFPDSYNTDANLTMPNQNAEGLPFGCTDETQADLSIDATLQFKNPFDLEAVTHANALGGYDIRKSLDAARTLGWFSAYFNVYPHQLDFFDSVRLAIMSGGLEKRSVSIGTPWYPKFEEVDGMGVLSAPRSFSTAGVGWHNWKICGWKLVNGEPHLIGKSWQGANYGDKGFHYASRALFNQLMAVPGSVAFTATAIKPDTIVKVDMGFVQWLMKYIKTLTGYAY